MFSAFHQACSIPQCTKKTIFDMWNGYHSIPLHMDDCHLTTFITLWGCYHYCTAPQGYITSGGGYTHCYNEIVAQIPQKTMCINDSLLWSNSIEESFWQANICDRNGITFNLTKFVFTSDTVEFAAFQITSVNVTPLSKVSASHPQLPKAKEHH